MEKFRDGVDDIKGDKWMTYLETHQEIHRMKELYKRATLEEARTGYDQYVRLIITDAKISKLEKETLFDVWDDLKFKINRENTERWCG